MSYFAYIMSQGVLESFDLSKGMSLLEKQEIRLQNKKFPWVLFEDEGKIFLTPIAEGYRITENEAEVQEEVEIYDGMYIEVQEKQGTKSYEILILLKNKVHVVHRYYHIESNIEIGSGTNCQIKSDLAGTLAPNHARIHRQGKSYFITSQLHRADVYVNNIRYQTRRLNLGDVIWCMGISIVFMGEFIAVSNHGVVVLDTYHPSVLEEVRKKETKVFEQVPRVVTTLEKGSVEILAPAPREVHKFPLYATLGPSFAMSLGMLSSVGTAIGTVAIAGPGSELIASGFKAFSYFLGAMLWPTLMASNQKKENALLDEKRVEKYSIYAEDVTRLLEDKYNRNRKIWNDLIAPSPETLVKMVQKLSIDSALWERTPGDRDFLLLRVGVGCHDFEVDIHLPPPSFHPEDDALSAHPEIIANRFKTLKDVPEVLHLSRDMCVGICGATELIWSLAKALMVETMALHSPEDVKTVFFFHDYEKEHFLWAKDLPSMWNDDQTIRFMASEQRQADVILDYLNRRMRDPSSHETYVFFVSKRSMLPKVGLRGSGTRIFYIFVHESLSDLPKECRTVIRTLNNSGGIYSQGEDGNVFTKFSQDDVSDQLLVDFRKALLEVPYTPPSRGRLVDDTVDRSVSLIDFAGQKLSSTPRSLTERLLAVEEETLELEPFIPANTRNSELLSASPYSLDTQSIAPAPTTPLPVVNPVPPSTNPMVEDGIDFMEVMDLEGTGEYNGAVIPIASPTEEDLPKEVLLENERDDEDDELEEEISVIVEMAPGEKDPLISTTAEVAPVTDAVRTAEEVKREAARKAADARKLAIVNQKLEEARIAEEERKIREAEGLAKAKREEELRNRKEAALRAQIEAEETARKAHEAHEARMAAETKRALEEYKAEQRREEEERKQEEAQRLEDALKRKEQQQEEMRKQEEAQKQEEARKQKEAQKLEAAIRLEEEKKKEQARKDEEIRQREEALEQARKLEDARRRDEARRQEEARKAEDARKQIEAKKREEAKIREEEANRKLEEARKREEEATRKLAEARRAEEMKRVIDQHALEVEFSEGGKPTPKVSEGTSLLDQVKQALESKKEPAPLRDFSENAQPNPFMSDSTIDEVPEEKLFDPTPMSELLPTNVKSAVPSLTMSKKRARKAMDAVVKQQDMPILKNILSGKEEIGPDAVSEFLAMREKSEELKQEETARMKKAPEDLDEVREAFMHSLRGKRPDLTRINMSGIAMNRGLFVGGTDESVVETLLYKLTNHIKLDYAFASQVSSQVRDNSPDVRRVWDTQNLSHAIEEIREYVWSFREEKCVIFIPKLAEFLNHIEKRDLERFSRVVKKHSNKVVILTGDVTENILPFMDTEFLDGVLREKQGIMTDPHGIHDLLPFLKDGFVPPAVTEDQTDFLYFNDKKWCTFQF